MRRKGMYFTLMTIAFLAIFIFLFSPGAYNHKRQEMESVEMRVIAMDSFVRGLERDISRGLYISSYRAMLALEEQVLRNGSYLHDVQAQFKEALLNGTVNNTPAHLMISSTFPDWIMNIQSKASGLNMVANITLNDISIYQNDPWHVALSANTSLLVEDLSGIASWNITRVLSTSFSISGFEDPVYIINSLGRMTNIINITPYAGNYTFSHEGEWNITLLVDHAQNMYYAANPDAPSFLQRLEGKITSSSPYGIESMVNPSRILDVGLEFNTGSTIIDYLYWQEEQGEYRVNNTPSWFRIDANHRSVYNVTQISYIS